MPEEKEEKQAPTGPWAILSKLDPRWLGKNGAWLAMLLAAFWQGYSGKDEAQQAAVAAKKAKTEAAVAQVEAGESREKLTKGWSQLAPAFNSLLQVTQELSKNQGRILGALEAKGIMAPRATPSKVEVLPAPKPPPLKPKRAPRRASRAPATSPPMAAAAAPPAPAMAHAPSKALKTYVEPRPKPKRAMLRRQQRPARVMVRMSPPPKKPDAGLPKPDQRVIKIRKLPDRLNQMQLQQQLPQVKEKKK